jgi:lysyl-tRNA synthetase, class II
MALRKRRTRSIILIACLALAAWSLVASLLSGGSGHVLLALGLGADVLALGGLTVLALSRRRSSRSPAAAAVQQHRHDELAAARHLVDRYGEDSISPFIVRPDKAYAFAAGGVVGYRVFGRTAVVSGDPVGPAGAAPAVAASFLDTARDRGWKVAVYGASEAQLATYHRLGLRSMCVGEEAVVRPETFSLEGRPVRKLRQSVRRVERRGWHIVALDGIDIDLATEAEIDVLETRWRAHRPRLLGFAMSMGPFEAGIRPRDLYLLARSPDGDLTAAMHFVAHRGKLSLATMRRVGENPNGLNEALVCRALEVARQRGVREVSLNYAGLAHLLRGGASGGWMRRAAIRIAVTVLGRRFQMERLVRFNDKFAPEWRPRYLVYPSRRALPRTIYRVLQAEGYLGRRRDARPPALTLSSLRAEPVPSSVRAYVSGR